MTTNIHDFAQFATNTLSIFSIGPRQTGHCCTLSAHSAHIDKCPQGSTAISSGFSMQMTHHGRTPLPPLPERRPLLVMLSDLSKRSVMSDFCFTIEFADFSGTSGAAFAGAFGAAGSRNCWLSVAVPQDIGATACPTDTAAAVSQAGANCCGAWDRAWEGAEASLGHVLGMLLPAPSWPSCRDAASSAAAVSQ